MLPSRLRSSEGSNRSLKAADKKSGSQYPLFMRPPVFLATWLALGALFALQEYVYARSWNYHHVSFGPLLLAWEGHFLAWGLICQIIWWKLRERIQRASIKDIFMTFVPLSIIVSVLEEVIWVACFPNIPIGQHGWHYLSRLRFFLDEELATNLVIFWIVFFLFRGVGYYQKLREHEFTALRLESELVNAQLRALRMQLNPHFLFNTMNSISSLMRFNVDTADQMLEQMSSMLRMTLDRGDAKLIPLNEEIEFIQLYLSIQQMRFESKAHTYVAIDPEVLDALVPTMILQPLVENAYVHGVTRSRGEKFLGVEAQNQHGQLRICVRNSGRGLSDGASSERNGHGVGIANVKSRLELHYGDHQRFTLQEFPDGEVQAILLLPLGFSPRLTGNNLASHSYENQSSHSG
jgi:two-component system, LytTR family, sensor kinase